MLLQYLLQWGHMYIMHVGAWITFAFGASIYKEGMPVTERIPSMIKTALILAAILSIFSSHSHHYISNILPNVISGE